MAARASASIGRPASSPQNDSLVSKRRAAGDDMFQEAQERQVQRVIAFADPFILAVGGEEELFQVIAADRNEIGQLKERIGGIGEAGGFQHRADFDASRARYGPRTVRGAISRSTWLRAI